MLAVQGVPEVVALQRAAAAVRDRAYVPLAPAAMAAVTADPVAVRTHLDGLQKEVAHVSKRLAAAQRAVDTELAGQEAATDRES